MLADIIRKLNWVDILVLFLIIRICYVAAKTGFTLEIFKLLGSAAALFISMHYYTVVSDLFRPRGAEQKMPLEFLDFISFILLAGLTYIAFILIRKAVFQFIKMEAVSALNKWGGLILGAARVFLVSSLLIFAMVISSINYLQQSALSSYSGKYLFKACISTYSSIWGGLMSKFMTKEKINKTVFEVESNLGSKK